jgi:hypothetical protein
VLAGNRNTIWVNDVGLNVASPQPTRQPKAVASGLEGERYAADIAPSIDCLISPAMQQLQKTAFINVQLLQRMTFYPRQNPSDEPTCPAHLNDGNQCAVLFKCSEGSAEIVRLCHRALRSLMTGADNVTLSPDAHSIFWCAFEDGEVKVIGDEPGNT